MRAWLRPKAPTPTTATLMKLSVRLVLRTEAELITYGLRSLELLQQGDLAGMIKLVLHDAAEHVKEVVVVLGLARNLFLQARVGKGGDRLDEFVVSLLGGFDRLAPGGFAGVFDRREILLVASASPPRRRCGGGQRHPRRRCAAEVPRCCERP